MNKTVQSVTTPTGKSEQMKRKLMRLLELRSDTVCTPTAISSLNDSKCTSGLLVTTQCQLK